MFRLSDIDIIVSDIFKFYNNHCPDYYNGISCPVDDNGAAPRFCNSKIKLTFRKSKLGKQGLSHVDPNNTWDKLPNNLKTAANINFLKHDVNKYFYQKFSETEADIYTYD